MFLLVLPLLATSIPAHASEPGCDSEPEVVASLRAITESTGSKKLSNVRRQTLAMLDNIKVHEMDWTEKFDCNDFAFAFDEECRRQGIDSWQMGIYANGFWRWSPSMGHALNVVQVHLPEDPKGKVRYAVVEPQDNTVVSTWLQRAGEAPDFPESKIPDLERAYPSFDLWNQEVTIRAEGHSPNAGEPAFTQDPRWMVIYEVITGHDPSDYDERSGPERMRDE